MPTTEVIAEACRSAADSAPGRSLMGAGRLAEGLPPGIPSRPQRRAAPETGPVR